MTAIAIPLSAPIASSLLPIVSGAVASALTAAQAAALLPTIIPVATAASGLSVLAAGAAAYQWGAAEITAMRNIAQTLYCAGTPGANGCPVAGGWELTIELAYKPGATNVEGTKFEKYGVQAPYNIGDGSALHGAAWVLNHAGRQGMFLAYKEHLYYKPEIVLAEPMGFDATPWEQLDADVRAAMAAALTAAHVQGRLANMPASTLQAGQNIGGNTLIVLPDGSATPLGEPYKVAEAPPPAAAHPYSGAAPVPVPRPGVRPAASGAVGAAAGAPGAVGAAAGAPGAVGAAAGAAIGAIAGAGIIGASSPATSASVGAGATATSGIGAASAPRVGAGATAGAVSGGQTIKVGNTTSFFPTTSTVVPANGTAPRTKTNGYAPTTTAASAGNPMDIAKIAGAVGAIPLAVGAVMSPALSKIPDVAGVTAAAATGACNAINGVNPCNVNNPIKKIQDGVNNLQTQLGALDLAGNAALGTQIAAFEAATMARFAKISAAINSDRIMMALTYLNTLHNAYFLSSNITQTLFSTASNAINAVLRLTGVQSANDDQIDVGQSVSSFVDNGMKEIFGVETWTGIKTQWKAFSRIYQAGANALFTVQSMFDAARSVAELGAENTGIIGNALRKAGIVGENAYRWMPERVNHTSAFQRKWDNITQTGENIEQAASVIDQVSGNVVEVLDGADQLVQTRKEFDEAVKAATPRERPDNEPVKTAVEASKLVSQPPSINPSDLVKPEA